LTVKYVLNIYAYERALNRSGVHQPVCDEIHAPNVMRQLCQRFYAWVSTNLPCSLTPRGLIAALAVDTKYGAGSLGIPLHLCPAKDQPIASGRMLINNTHDECPYPFVLDRLEV
jgi:hypothetical protein